MSRVYTDFVLLDVHLCFSSRLCFDSRRSVARHVRCRSTSPSVRQLGCWCGAAGGLSVPRLHSSSTLILPIHCSYISAKTTFNISDRNRPPYTKRILPDCSALAQPGWEPGRPATRDPGTRTTPQSSPLSSMSSWIGSPRRWMTAVSRFRVRGWSSLRESLPKHVLLAEWTSHLSTAMLDTRTPGPVRPGPTRPST